MALAGATPVPLDELRRAVKRTVDQEAAQLKVERVGSPLDWTKPGHERPAGTMGAVVRLLGRGAWTSTGDGAIEFAGGRVMVRYDDGGSSMLIGDRLWQGSSGDLIADRKPRETVANQPLWVFDLVHGLVDAQLSGPDHVGEHACRRFSAHSDLVLVDEAVSYAVRLPFPSFDWVDELRRMPLSIWVDEHQLIRRVRATLPIEQITIDLVAFGSASQIDWSRLP